LQVRQKLYLKRGLLLLYGRNSTPIISIVLPTLQTKYFRTETQHCSCVHVFLISWWYVLDTQVKSSQDACLLMRISFQTNRSILNCTLPFLPPFINHTALNTLVTQPMIRGPLPFRGLIYACPQISINMFYHSEEN
jgi:hypothetical protein